MSREKRKAGKTYIYQEELQGVKRFSLWVNLTHIPYGILMPILIARVVTRAVAGEVKAVACFAAALLSLLAAFLLLQIRLHTALKQKMLEAEQRCKLKLYRQFYANPLHLLHRSSLGGNLENFSNDLTTVTGRLMTDRPTMTAAVAETLLFGGYLLWLSPLAGAIILGISLLQVIPPLLVRKYLQVNYDKCRKIEGDITNFVVTAFQGFLLIKLYGLKDWWLGKLNEIYKRYWVIGNESVFANRSEVGMYALLDNILKYGTYCIIGLLLLGGFLTMDAGVQAIALSTGIYGAVKKAFETLPRFAMADQAQERILKWYGQAADWVAGPSAGSTAGLTDSPTGTWEGSRIRMEGIQFSYEESLLAFPLAEMDMGEINILRGPNGIGKSTLFRLLTGIEKAQEGTVLIGDRRPEELGKECFPAQFFYLLQEDPAFDMTPEEMYDSVEESLSGQGLSLDRERLCRNTERLGADASLLRERKISQLSQGERKKVFLALAFALAPGLLLLDEPTNHLDAAGKAVLLELLKERRGGAVIITHDELFDGLEGCRFRLQEGRLYHE